MLPRCKASGAPAAVHSAGADRPGHRTSHVLNNGGLFTFMECKMTMQGTKKQDAL